MSRAWFFDAVWYRNYPQSRSGDRFLNILESHNLRKHMFCQKLTFLNELFETAPTTLGRSSRESLSKASKLDLKMLKSSKLLRLDPETSDWGCQQ